MHPRSLPISAVFSVLLRGSDATIEVWNLRGGEGLRVQSLSTAFCNAVTQLLWLDEATFVAGFASGMLGVFRRTEKGHEVVYNASQLVVRRSLHGPG